MQPCGGCARRHLSGFARRLLGGHAVPAPLPVSMSAPSVDEQRVHLEGMLAATMIVLFLASVSYFALSTLYGCIRAWTGRRQQPVGADGDSGAPAPSAVGGREETKRALEGIPVQVVMVDEEEPDCAVCLAEYAAGDEVRVLPACRHGFHRECVDRWLLTRAPTCPVCRAPIGPVEGPDAKEDCATERADIGSASFAGSRMLPAMWP